MKFFLMLMVFAAALSSCSETDTKENPPVSDQDDFIRAADISRLPELEFHNVVFSSGETQSLLTTLNDAGCNTVRIRLWKNPANQHSGFQEVKSLAQRAHQQGFKVWLTVHYSDTWADPGQQQLPAEWENLLFAQLKLEMQQYTSQIVSEIAPDIIQIGNEINSGLLWPHGNLNDNESQFLELLALASQTIREESPQTKIMLHFAGISGATWFFDKIANIDYDYAGLSYYPVWHGKDLSLLSSTIETIGSQHGKKVLIAETAYPFTLDWEDWTNNIVGLENQLIPGYPATPEGQKNFMLDLHTMLKASNSAIGFSYWGGEWVSFMGNQAANGSSWENQALYDFENQSLPVLAAFNKQ